MDYRQALKRELVRSLARLSIVSFARPSLSHGHIARTYGIHVMYVPLCWTHVARVDIRMYVPSRRYVHRLEEERSLLRERRIALSGLLPSSSSHHYGRHGYLWHYMYSTDVYYILKGDETFQMTFKLHIILSSCRRGYVAETRWAFLNIVLNLLILIFRFMRSLCLNFYQDFILIILKTR